MENNSFNIEQSKNNRINLIPSYLVLSKLFKVSKIILCSFTYT